MPSPAFVHLRLHTEFSLQDSVVRIPELVERAAALGMPAVAVTDQNNLFAMVKFYREGLKCGVKPIIGVDVLLRAGERLPPNRLTLLCKDPGGYQNVANLVTRAWLEGQDRGVPLHRPRLADAGDHRRADRAVGIRRGRRRPRHRQRPRSRRARRWRANGRSFSAIATTSSCSVSGAPTTNRWWPRPSRLSQKAGISVVATNDVRFLAASDFESHEARVCISDGAQLADPGRQRRYTEAQYLRSPEEMARAVRRHSRGAAEFGGDRAPLFAAAQARRIAPA